MNFGKAVAGLLLLCVTAIDAQQVKNVTFKDINGTSYDLYTFLNAGKYVVLDFMSND